MRVRTLDDGLRLIEVDGDVDFSNVALLDQSIAGLDAEITILSLERCTYVDSTAINAMLRVANARDGRIVVIVPATSPVRRIFELTGLIEYLHVVENLDVAASLGAAMRASNAVTFSSDAVARGE